LFQYILKKIITGFFVLLGVVALVFILFQLVRFNPAYAVAGEQANEQTVKNITKELGLDLPAGIQFLRYLNDISPLSIHTTVDPANAFYLDTEKYKYIPVARFGYRNLIIKIPYLGRSILTGRSVSSLLGERIPNTLVLALSAIMLATAMGVLLGVLASVKPNSITDIVCTAGSVMGISLPSFFAAIVLQLVFAYLLASLTGLHLTGNLYVSDAYTGEEYFSFKNLVLPAIALGIRPIAVIAQVTRSSMLDVLHMDFIRTAYAKGLDKRVVLLKHALRNALIPVITSVTGWLASLLAGAFFIEVIFQYNGLGLETVNAIKTKDVPVAMGAMIFTAIIFVLVQIVTDILYSISDARVKSNTA
jgi:peptide/nickel transport system permease protein